MKITKIKLEIISAKLSTEVKIVETLMNIIEIIGTILSNLSPILQSIKEIKIKELEGKPVEELQRVEQEIEAFLKSFQLNNDDLSERFQFINQEILFFENQNFLETFSEALKEGNNQVKIEKILDHITNYINGLVIYLQRCNN